MNQHRPSNPKQLWLALATVILMTSTAYAQPPSVTTQMYDNSHDGWNPNETQLNIANVSSSFQLLFKDTTDAPTYAQPLYVPGVNLGGTLHNVIFVATENNTVYAFDADTVGAPLWATNLTPANETLQVSNDYNNTRIPKIGITGTPVIDTATGTIYAVAASKTIASPTVFHQRLHALDITTGQERANSPVDITAKVPGTGGEQDGNGNELFDPLVEFNRAALTLFGNNIYTAWSAHEDNGSQQAQFLNDYQGWVIAYDKTSLAQTAVFNDAPNLPQMTGGGSIWGASVGLVADSASIYAITSNGQFDSNADYSDTALRLGPTLNVADSFTPCNQQELGENDVDLGSGSAMILPSQSSGPANLLTFAGKEGSIYLINRNAMGGYTPTTVCTPGLPCNLECTDNVVQELWRVLGVTPVTSPDGANRDAFWGAPAFFADGSGRQYVYYTGDYSPIVEFDLANGTLTPGTVPGGNLNQTATSTYNFAHGGTIPVISSNGGDTTTAIVWAIKHPLPPSDGSGTLMLDAFPANNLTNEIVTDIPAGSWSYSNDAFLIPTVVNGKVYVSSAGELDVFGVNAVTPPPIPGAIRFSRIKMNFGKRRVNSSETGRFIVRNAGKGVLHVNFGTTLQAPFQLLNGTPVSLAKGKTVKVEVTFVPTATGANNQTLMVFSDDPKHPTTNITIEGTGR